MCMYVLSRQLTVSRFLLFFCHQYQELLQINLSNTCVYVKESCSKCVGNKINDWFGGADTGASEVFAADCRNGLPVQHQRLRRRVAFWWETTSGMDAWHFDLCVRVPQYTVLDFYVSIGMLLKHMVGSSLLFKDEPLTLNTDEVVPVLTFRRRAQNMTIGKKWTSHFCFYFFLGLRRKNAVQKFFNAQFGSRWCDRWNNSD